MTVKMTADHNVFEFTKPTVDGMVPMADLAPLCLLVAQAAVAAVAEFGPGVKLTTGIVEDSNHLALDAKP